MSTADPLAVLDIRREQRRVANLLQRENKTHHAKSRRHQKNLADVGRHSTVDEALASKPTFLPPISSLANPQTVSNTSPSNRLALPEINPTSPNRSYDGLLRPQDINGFSYESVVNRAVGQFDPKCLSVAVDAAHDVDRLLLVAGDTDRQTTKVRFVARGGAGVDECHASRRPPVVVPDTRQSLPKVVQHRYSRSKFQDDTLHGQSTHHLRCSAAQSGTGSAASGDECRRSDTNAYALLTSRVTSSLSDVSVLQRLYGISRDSTAVTSQSLIGIDRSRSRDGTLETGTNNDEPTVDSRADDEQSGAGSHLGHDQLALASARFKITSDNARLGRNVDWEGYEISRAFVFSYFDLMPVRGGRGAETSALKGAKALGSKRQKKSSRK